MLPANLLACGRLQLSRRDYPVMVISILIFKLQKTCSTLAISLSLSSLLRSKDYHLQRTKNFAYEKWKEHSAKLILKVCHLIKRVPIVHFLKEIEEKGNQGTKCCYKFRLAWFLF